MRIFEVLVLIAAVVVLLTFFFRAWANLRRGKRFERYNRRISESADLELQRLQNATRGRCGSPARSSGGS